MVHNMHSFMPFEMVPGCQQLYQFEDWRLSSKNVLLLRRKFAKMCCWSVCTSKLDYFNRSRLLELLLMARLLTNNLLVIREHTQVAARQEMGVETVDAGSNPITVDGGLARELVQATYKTKLELELAQLERIRMERELRAAQHVVEMARLQRNEEINKEVERAQLQTEKEKLKRLADLEINMKETEMIIQEDKLNKLAEIEIKAKEDKIVRAKQGQRLLATTSIVVHKYC